MSGKKVAIYFVAFIVVICLLIVIAMQIFFATYEPKKDTTINETSLITPVNKEEISRL
ncbi:hypothetical protein H9636_07715 [Ureibacillus sp. Re31]|uniref:Tumour necrosis factor receptor superfamily member 19 n=1 Tax=Ureibacillus galli TaxID=2762222 RepID=A0ABR8XBF3_9BACL|nr:hypothetical protein [Ureibacillus galli]MBD8026539.1 hypothetical protein [Ureibacillus galli]